MLVSEILTEKYIHNIDFDLATFARNMAALRASNHMPDNYPDAILFLGYIGDPDTKVSWNSRPAKIANYDRSGEYAANLPKHQQGPWRNDTPELDSVTGKSYTAVKGEYGRRVIDPSVAANPNELEFDIWITSEYADMRNPRALQQSQTQTIAHELRHRGFAIIDSLPNLKSRMPEIYQSVGNMGHPTSPQHQQFILNKVNARSKEHNFYLAHAMMYALEYNNAGNIYDDDKQQQAYKKLYWDCERVVRQYLDGKSVPPQGWALLRNQIDKATPDNVQISVKPGPDHAVVTGTTKPAETPSNTPSAPRVFIDKWTGGKTTTPPKPTGPKTLGTFDKLKLITKGVPQGSKMRVDKYGRIIQDQ
jgi:hypothetical protein